MAISLHASTDEIRKKIMPIANKYTIEEILDACKYYINKTNRRITFEYALVKELMIVQKMQKLSKLLKDMFAMLI